MSLLLLLVYYVSFVLAQNSTRNYTVGIKVSQVWYSGSEDTMYFQICNTQCLKWYVISGGMANRGDWYYFDYPEQLDIGTPTSMKLLTQNNDQFCVSQVSIDGVKYDDTTVDCIEVSDTKPVGSCSVIDVAFNTAPNAEFTGTLYEGTECPYDVTESNIYSGPPITTANGTRTYELSLTVSNWISSGTSNDLYLRLCTDELRTDCTIKCDDAMTNCESDWYIFSGGVKEEGDTYKGYWNTKDIGNVNYADIVTFGSDTFCLSRLMVDGITANAGLSPECISDETKDGCATLSIALSQSVFASTSVEQCSYGIINNETFVAVDKYVFEFKIGATPWCGAESTIFFIFCGIDGDTESTDYCSKIYEIGGQMPQEEEIYSYTIDITGYDVFNTLSDVYFVDVWEYDTETWCLSDITINGIILDPKSTLNGPNADSTPALQMESDVNDGVYCNGVRVFMQTNVWQEFADGPVKKYKIKKCRWNDLKASQGTVLVSKQSTKQTVWDWMESGYNWIYICLVLIGIVICCIVLCAILQHFKKKQDGQIEDSNKPWHGGNSAFY